MSAAVGGTLGSSRDAPAENGKSIRMLTTVAEAIATEVIPIGRLGPDRLHPGSRASATPIRIAAGTPSSRVRWNGKRGKSRNIGRPPTATESQTVPRRRTADAVAERDM